MRYRYLDGLRGWAAIIVVLHHLTTLFLIQIPVLDILSLQFLRDGTMAVFVFFAISGFALSIGYIEKRQRRLVVDMALRRYPRLAIPTCGGCLLTYLLMKAGAMHNVELSPVLNQPWLGQHFAFTPKIWNLLRFAFGQVFFSNDVTRSFDTPLWTMSVELKGSFLLFAVLLLFRGKALRMLAGAALCLHYWLTDSYMLTFVMGMLIADSSTLFRDRSFRTGWIVCAAGLLLIAGMTFYLYESRATVAGPRAYSMFAGIILASLVISTRLAHIFETRVSTWLGKVSFSLYLVHMPLITSLSCVLMIRLLAHGIAMQPAMIACFLISLPCLLLAARLFYPVESLGITISHRISEFVLARTAPWFDALRLRVPAAITTPASP